MRTERGSHSQPDSCNFSPTSRPEVLSSNVSRLDQMEIGDWSNSPVLSALSLRIFQMIADPIIGKSNEMSHTIHPPFRHSKCVSTFRRKKDLQPSDCSKTLSLKRSAIKKVCGLLWRRINLIVAAQSPMRKSNIKRWEMLTPACAPYTFNLPLLIPTKFPPRPLLPCHSSEIPCRVRSHITDEIAVVHLRCSFGTVGIPALFLASSDKWVAEAWDPRWQMKLSICGVWRTHVPYCSILPTLLPFWQENMWQPWSQLHAPPPEPSVAASHTAAMVTKTPRP